jgi:hypothetical protein
MKLSLGWRSVREPSRLPAEGTPIITSGSNQVLADGGQESLASWPPNSRLT